MSLQLCRRLSQDHQDRGALLLGQDEALPAGRGPRKAAPAAEEGGRGGGQEAAQRRERLLHRQKDPTVEHPRRVGEQGSWFIRPASVLTKG